MDVLSWWDPEQAALLAVLAGVGLLIAPDTLPPVGPAVPGDVAVVGVVTVAIAGRALRGAPGPGPRPVRSSGR